MLKLLDKMSAFIFYPTKKEKYERIDKVERKDFKLGELNE